MKRQNAKLFLLSGAWLSLMAFIVGGSLLLPQQLTVPEKEAALLYKFASNDLPPASPRAPESGKSLIADLDLMQLSLYDGGVLVKSFPILSKGRPGTPWETPRGTYVIQTKETKHRSSIGGTWMPYSMQFYGNFFIHGWPTYSDGTDVPIGYSGGCIRLSTKDAEEIYEFTPKGATVLVLGALPPDQFATSSRFYLRGGGMPPEISASSFMVQDVDSGRVLWERAQNEPKHPGGLTQMATALTALETVNQYKIVRMSELLLGKAVLRKHSIGEVDEMPVGTLIYPLMFDTNDTAARVFAKEHGEKQFVRTMNQKASAIGMSESKFTGVVSTDDATTTARDLATLLRYVEANKHFLIDVTLAKDRTLSDKDGDKRYVWENRNPWVLSADGEFRGGVVGVSNQADKKNAMVLFDLPVSEFGTRKIAFVVLDSSNITADIEALRTFVTEHFVYGAERASDTFIREGEEPTPGLLKKAKDLLELEKVLQDEVEYERDV